MIYTKVGDPVTNIRIDSACYFDGRLIKVLGTVNGVERPHYISDLKGDEEGEVEAVIKVTLKKIKGNS